MCHKRKEDIQEAAVCFMNAYVLSATSNCSNSGQFYACAYMFFLLPVATAASMQVIVSCAKCL